MTQNTNHNFHRNMTKINEIQKNQTLPTIIQGSLTNVNKTHLDAFKRKIAHQNRIEKQEIKLSEQLNSDYNELPPIQISFNSNTGQKRMSLSDLEEKFENKPIISPEKKLKKLSKTNKKSIIKKIRVSKKHSAVAIGMLSMVLIAGFTFSNLSNTQNNNDKVAFAAEAPIKSSLQQKKDAYSDWIKSQNDGKFVDANEDSDKDGLTNFEEFVIGSKTFSPNSCNENINDSENLINLINPATCKGIELDSPEDAKKFGDIINLPLIKTEIGKKKEVIESSNSSIVNVQDEELTSNI